MAGRDLIAQHSIRETNLNIGIDVTTAKLLWGIAFWGEKIFEKNNL